MKRIFSLIVVCFMILGLVTGCASGTNKTNNKTSTSSENNSKNSGTSTNGKIDVAVSLADASDYYIGTMVGAKVVDAFKKAGANVDVLDAASQVTTQLQQIQNAVTKGAKIIYVFPAGNGEAYTDTLRKAREAGVKVMVSNNKPGDGSYDVYVGSEEFYMGAMQAAMVTQWINNTMPQAKEVKALILEAHLNQTMARRCLGMRLISEKFLRKADLTNMRFVKTQGPTVYYKDSDGTVKKVDEPTGGLILDKNGYAILNPFYDPRVKLIETANRTSVGYTATEAQAALDNAVTNGNNDIQVIMAYGNIGIPLSDKVIQMSKAGRFKYDLSKMAVFCSDATDANLKAISQSSNNTTVLRGVMASGDLVKTLCDYAAKLVKGQPVLRITMEPLSYVMADSTGQVKTVYYHDQLTPYIEQIFGQSN